ncbi:hypothetical protein MTR62_19675, partial [Novosphingobium sp. 1949]
ATPGTWRLSAGADGSFARFGAASGGDLFSLQCDARTRTITLRRSAPGATGRASLAITTSDGAQALSAFADAQGYVVTLPAGSPLLDQMAFSRGRFAVTLTGQPTLYLPSWTEVSRVIEDCR